MARATAWAGDAAAACTLPRRRRSASSRRTRLRPTRLRRVRPHRSRRRCSPAAARDCRFVTCGARRLGIGPGPARSASATAPHGRHGPVPFTRSPRHASRGNPRKARIRAVRERPGVRKHDASRERRAAPRRGEIAPNADPTRHSVQSQRGLCSCPSRRDRSGARWGRPNPRSAASMHRARRPDSDAPYRLVSRELPGGRSGENILRPDVRLGLFGRQHWKCERRDTSETGQLVATYNQ
jgi:hypothetical protein